MNKRKFLQTIAGGRSGEELSSPPIMTSLSPYMGPWEKANAMHLLTRCSFAQTRENIEQSVNEGLELTLDRLFEPKPEADLPVHYQFENDSNAPLGETWVNKPTNPEINNLLNARRRSLRAWFIGLMKNGGVSLHGKMMLFWHEHFALGDINRAQYLFHYLNIFERHSLGNFKTITEEITINPAMLIFLNGDENTKESPNENYARELLELFTIGRGDDLGDGDYTNYTEQDVFAIARALTGYRQFTNAQGEVGGLFIENRHDTDIKELSHRFENQIIENGGDQEYKTVIDIIFQKQEVARFISRQLHIWFVGADINEQVEANIIEPMSQIIFDNNFEIAPALRTLLRSDYFNSTERHGCMINSPIDYLFKLMNVMEVDSPNDLIEQYQEWNTISLASSDQGIFVTEIPSVAGWKAYYQAPLFYKFWISSVTLTTRETIIDRFIQGFNNGGNTFKFELIDFVASIENAADPNILISSLSDSLMVIGLSQNQIDSLKIILTNDIGDFVWTNDYEAFLDDPTDNGKRQIIENRLKGLFTSLLKMPEFYLH